MKKKNLLYYLTKHPVIAVVIILIASLAAIITIIQVFYSRDSKNINIGDDVVINDSLIAQDSPGASLVINENKTIPYSRRWVIIENKFGQEDWLERYSVLFVLPNGDKAFLPKMESQKEYIVAYTNEDCSDIYINELYRLPENFQESKVCWIKELFCGEEERSQELNFLDSEIKKNKDNIKIASENNNESQLEEFLQNRDDLSCGLYKIISYSPGEAFNEQPTDECIKFLDSESSSE